MPMLAEVMSRVADAIRKLAERVDELERLETYYGTLDLGGATLAALSDITLDGNGHTLTTLSDVTLDGNGHTLTLSADATLSGTPAPADAKYIVQQANSGLSAEQALGALATGILKNTTSTGVLTIAAAGTDYAAASHTHAGTDIASGTVAAARLGSGSPSATTLLFGDSSWAALVAADIPNLAAAKIASGTLAAARLGAGTTNATTFLRGDGSWTNTLGGNLGLSAGNGFFVGGVQVAGARRTGWSAWTGNATRTSKATSTATLVNVAEAVKALIDDLTAHGLIGA